MCIIKFVHFFAMDGRSMTIINIMRQMRVNSPLNLDDIHKQHADTKLYRGRPEMLLMKMNNGRNVQLFRKGTIQIFGAISHSDALSMRSELLTKLKMENSQMTELTIANMVISVQLCQKICLQNVLSSNSDVQYESEIFPAALISKWEPAHVAAFHNGKVIITGVKSLQSAETIIDYLIEYLQEHSLIL